jgi:ketosteroid isomerase-like protein
MNEPRRAMIVTSTAALAALATGAARSAVERAASDPDTRAVLDRAVANFFAGWATGDWEPYLEMLADDFVFQFPIGPYRGRHTGAGARQAMIAWAREHGAANNLISQSSIDIRLYDRDWVVVCDRGIGHIGGSPYNGLHAIFMKASGGKIVEYREYMGDIAGGAG